MNISHKIVAILSITLFCASITHTKSFDCSNVPYEQVIKKYVALAATGLDAHIDLTGCNIERIRTSDTIKQYITNLCKLLKIRPFEQPTLAHYSSGKNNTGYAFVLQTEQATVSGRFINASNSALINIHGTSLFDPQEVAAFSKNHFGASDCSVAVNIRK